MALHTKVGFSKTCGITTGHLAVYLKRGKVVMSGDYIDDSVGNNATFLKKCQQKRGVADITADEPEVLPEKGKLRRLSADQSDVINKMFPKPGGLEAEKTAQQIEKLQQEVSLLKVKNEKAQGQSVQIDLVKALFSRHTKFTLVEYSNCMDKMIVRLAKRYSIPKQETAELKKEMIVEINQFTKKADEETRKDLVNIVNEFTKKKENGERN